MLRSPVVIAAIAACSPEGSSPSPGGSDASSHEPDVPPVALACTGKLSQPVDATWMIAGRAVRVHVPASYAPTHPASLVINLHGLSGDGASQANVSRMHATSDTAGFIAVHPDGTGSPRGWNGGDCCNPAASNHVADTAFIGEVIDEASTRLCIDPDRVHAIGLSNGGFLAHRLGCELADRIASFGAVAGVLGIDDCKPARPLAVFHVHGTSDYIIPYNGGGVNGSKSVADTIAGWKSRNGCTAAAITVHQQGDATCVRHGGCAGDADVELCTIDGGGHQWPGGESIGGIHGKKSDDVIATERAWAFFVAHPRAAPH